jgi:hypothetical protein
MTEINEDVRNLRIKLREINSKIATDLTEVRDSFHSILLRIDKTLESLE